MFVFGSCQLPTPTYFFFNNQYIYFILNLFNPSNPLSGYDVDKMN